MQLHFAQALYFVAFTSAFYWPHLLNRASLRRTAQRALGSPVRLLCLLGALAMTSVVVARFTLSLALVNGQRAQRETCRIIHPFVLADNRHYTFYFNKRVLSRTWWSKYAFVPAYVAAGYLLFDALGQRPHASPSLC